MGTARAPVAGSGFCPACRERVPKPKIRSFCSAIGLSYDRTFSNLVAGALDTGAAYVYVRNGSTWNQQAVLTPSNAGGSFGESVAISGDLIIIGAPRNAATARA